MALIEGCACGQDHETMPMIDISDCFCLILGDQPGCTHEVFEVPAVCVKHKRHEPCRPCMREEGFTASTASTD